MTRQETAKGKIAPLRPEATPDQLKALEDATHAATCDLYAFAAVLDGFLGASEPPPLEMLRDWIKRIANGLDEASVSLNCGEASA